MFMDRPRVRPLQVVRTCPQFEVMHEHRSGRFTSTGAMRRRRGKANAVPIRAKRHRLQDLAQALPLGTRTELFTHGRRLNPRSVSRGRRRREFNHRLGRCFNSRGIPRPSITGDFGSRAPKSRVRAKSRDITCDYTLPERAALRAIVLNSADYFVEFHVISESRAKMRRTPRSST